MNLGYTKVSTKDLKSILGHSERPIIECFTKTQHICCHYLGKVNIFVVTLLFIGFLITHNTKTNANIFAQNNLYL